MNIAPSLFPFSVTQAKNHFPGHGGRVVLGQEFLELLRRAKAAGALKEAGGWFSWQFFWLWSGGNRLTRCFTNGIHKNHLKTHVL